MSGWIVVDDLNRRVKGFTFLAGAQELCAVMNAYFEGTERTFTIVRGSG